MHRPVLAATLSIALVAGLAAAASASPGGGPTPALSLSPVGTHFSDIFDASAAEIVKYDAKSQRAFVVNAQSGAVDVLSIRKPSDPVKIDEISAAGLVAQDGSTIDDEAVVNSIAINDGVVAVAVEAADKTQLGWVAFFRAGGESDFLRAVRAGSLPDMVTFTPNGRAVVVANEGEPADDFSSDPEGSVSIIDLSKGVKQVSQDSVRTATFAAWDTGEKTLPDGVRVFGPDVPSPLPGNPGRIARNLEPEYVTVSSNSRTAYVALQEANAIAVLDLRRGAFTDILPLGTKDWSAEGNVLDASDRDGAINIRNWPIRGMYMPDAVEVVRIKGREYLVTANEGDAREWGSYVENVRLGSSSYPLCADVFENAADLKSLANLGRLNVSTEDGRRDSGCYEEIHAYGARSFSLWTTNGDLVFDSAGQFEEKIAELIDGGELPGVAFNANHSGNATFDSRSDDKGVEPEGLAVGTIKGRTYAFIGLERIGGVMTYDITRPRQPVFVDYVNNRDWSVVFDEDSSVETLRSVGDLGAEGLEFVSGKDSPTRKPLLLTGNEVSGTTTVFAVLRDKPGHDRSGR